MKVAIIGAGPVGSWLAGRLAEKGEDVTVFERKKSPGGKACSGLVSERIWKFIPRNKRLVENEITDVSIHFPRRTITVNFVPRMLALDRQKLDRYMAGLAKRAGVRMKFDANFEGFRESRGQVVVKCDGKEEAFDRVIGCDGAISTVRAAITGKSPRFRTGVQCFQRNSPAGKTADVWPTDKGFYWKVPRGKTTEWGAFGPGWETFAERNGLSGLPVQSAVIPEGVQTTGNNRITLCGDAAGLTKPWSGGGIVWGLTAARMLLENWPNFRAYEDRLKAAFGARIAAGRLAAAAVNALGSTVPWALPKSFDSDWLF